MKSLSVSFIYVYKIDAKQSVADKKGNKDLYTFRGIVDATVILWPRAANAFINAWKGCWWL